MKKLYIIFFSLLVLGISSGIFYFSYFKQSQYQFPENVTMETAWGQPYSFDTIEPKVRLIEFMYGNCPDVCPVTTWEMQKIRDDLKAQGIFGDKVEFITITIDPKRDTKEKLQEYAKAFKINKDEGWYLLRGSYEDTKKVADSFEFLFRDPGNGMYVHSTFTYLMDEKNNVIEKFGMGENGFDRERVYKRIMRIVD
ncbi:SCO family protein [Bacillus sp. HMF5848]|uniref:SCO family protein n=1 Tax=Bacillus sp. HMF5848 TaxID=2495421 RepID=UPI000F76FE6F|nr:SCO family protein [Bacillus sp. HMF5848]RSK26348.1 SCO family protein [Bacillus sp. HMF5848]